MITTSAQTQQINRIDRSTDSERPDNYSGAEPPVSRVEPGQALRLNEHISASYAAYLAQVETSDANSRKQISNYLTSNLHRSGLLLFPIAHTAASILKMYSSTAYGLGLATKDAALHFMAPIEVEVNGEVDVQTSRGDQVCSTLIKDRYHLPDNPGIDLADLNLPLSIMGFLLGEAGEIIFDTLENRSHAFLASKSVAHGIHQGVIQFLNNRINFTPNPIHTSHIASNPIEEGQVEEDPLEAAQIEARGTPSYLASINPLPAYRKTSALVKAAGLFGVMAYIHSRWREIAVC